MINWVIDFDSTYNKPKYMLLYEHIKSEIHCGKIKEAEKLPSIRQVCEQLSLSKMTVENAYHQLLCEGYIESKYKSGYYVVAITYIEKKSEDIFNYPKPVPDPNKIFDTDKTLEKAFRFTEWKKVLGQVIEYRQATLLTTGDVQGEYEFRVEIAKFVHQMRGVNCDPEQIIIGAGIQNLFGLIATLLSSVDKRISFEYPGFSKGMIIFKDYGYQTIKVPVGDEGININELDENGTRLVYVSPSHQYPTGYIMPIQKRLNLIKWAEKNNGYIIEDDYDSLLRYEGYPIPALQGLDHSERVIYTGSFSKLLIPSIRISFVILPKSLLKRYQPVKEKYTQTVSKIEQLALANYMSEGLFDRQIRRVKKIYSKKNQKITDYFHQQVGLSNHIKLIGQSTGLHLMFAFDSEVKSGIVIEKCNKVGIKLEPVENDDIEQIAVLSYSGIEDNEVEPIIDYIIKCTIEATYSDLIVY